MRLERNVVRPLPEPVLKDRVTPRERRPRALWPLLIVMGLLSVGGFVGGLSFVRDRTGEALGAKLSWLEKTPVHDFLLPGLFLLAVYGLGGLLLMAGLTWRASPGPLQRVDALLGHRWAWTGTVLVGAILVAWILYEFWIFPDKMVLQPILIGVGASMVAIPLLPSMRRHYATQTRGRVMTERDGLRTAAYQLSWIVVAASVVASIGGLFAHGLYQDDTSWATAALRGGDFVTLAIVVPAFIVALLLADRGSARATLVWIGMLAYCVYNFAFSVFGAAFNDLFLVHVVAFAASIFALIALLPTLDVASIAKRFGPRTPRRAVAVFLLVVAAGFATLWTVFSLRFAIVGSLSLGAATLPGMHLVFALDLSLMAPSLALAGVLLWRRRAWGLVLASALSVFGAAYQLNLAAAGVFQSNAHVAGVKSVDPIGIAFIAAFLLSSIAMLGNLRAERRTRSNDRELVDTS